MNLVLRYAIKMSTLSNSVAIIATGDEMINGEIANSNAQHIAQQLWQNHFDLGIQMIVSDQQTDLEAAIGFALDNNRAVITIGGLGPTLDDRTRFAIANCMRRPLVFNKDVWQAINRLRARRKLRDLPENNRQQAMFIANSHILQNHHGTAAGFMVRAQTTIVTALPGPPRECLPMFDNRVLPQLLSEIKPAKQYRKAWTLMNVSESHIASLAEPLVADLNIELGFRVYKPLLDVKISGNSQQDFEGAVELLENLFAERKVNIR